MQAALTLYDKIWLSHLVVGFDDDHGLMYVDRQMLHEVSSPQAFVGARTRAVPVYRSAAHLAVADHAVPTRDQLAVIKDPLARQQVALLEKNVSEFDISYIPVGDTRHGIVHIIGPELGFTQPGMTLVCGDSHTSTHGAFGALAMGIGASECECVLSTQTLRQKRAHNMLVKIEGSLPAGVFAKDLALAVVARIGAGGATGYAIEYAGSTVRALSMEGRMTLCNMTIEAGARNGLVAPDETTFDYLKGRPLSPSGELWHQALEYWQNLHSDQGAEFLRTVEIDATKLVPQVTWGTSPDQVAAISGQVPYPHDFDTSAERAKVQRAIDYMGLTPGAALQSVSIDQVFIGSCTNGRIEDLRAAAAILHKRSCAPHVTAIVVPGSGQVRAQAEKEGLDKIFIDAGFEWRSPGCSLCVAMNDDRLAPGIRCASTSNRNFEGRQGAGARTHLMSPAMAAACAVAGHLTDVRDWIVA